MIQTTEGFDTEIPKVYFESLLSYIIQYFNYFYDKYGSEVCYKQWSLYLPLSVLG